MNKETKRLKTINKKFFSYMPRVAVVMAVLTMATLPGVGSTLARFSSYAEESTSARVSKWIVDVAHAAEGGNTVVININDMNPEDGFIFAVTSDSETSVRYDITVTGLKKDIDVVLCSDSETPEELARYKYDEEYGLPETVVFTNVGMFSPGSHITKYILKFIAGTDAEIETVSLKVGARFYQIEDYASLPDPSAVPEGLVPDSPPLMLAPASEESNQETDGESESDESESEGI